MTDIAELRGKSPDELEALLLDLRKEQFNLRFQRATGQLEAVGRVRQVRRDIARVKTLQAQANPSRRAVLRGARRPAAAAAPPSPNPSQP